MFNLTSFYQAARFNLKKSNLSNAAASRNKGVIEVEEFKDSFWFQKISPIKDAVGFLTGTDRQFFYKLIVVTAETLSIANSLNSKNNIERQVLLTQLYDPDIDDAKKGICCNRIKYYQFPRVKCVGKKCAEEENRRKIFPPTEAQLNAEPDTANNCLDIFIFQQIAWRICHRNEDNILKLKQTLVYGALKTIPGVDQKDLMSQFVNHSDSTPITAPSYWDWHDQTKWGGNCNSGIMQAPINVQVPDPSPEAKTPASFVIDYKFSNKIPVSLRINVAEIFIHFDDFAGGIKIEYGEGKMLSYTVRKMVFRFPAEHTINGYRLDGEFVLIGQEITQDDNRALAITNGLEFAIPIQFNPDSPIYDELDVLSPDKWRSELKDTDKFIPKNALNGKAAIFDLAGFMTKVMNLKSDFSLYLGSSTTPPCIDRVYQLIMDTPLLIANCQFKALRENTLKSDSLKETHARQIQINPFGGKSGLKNIKFEQMKAMTSLNQLVPEREMQNIVASSQDDEETPEKPVESAVAKKEKEKEEAKALFRSKVSCDLVRTYNPPVPPAQPSESN